MRTLIVSLVCLLLFLHITTLSFPTICAQEGDSSNQLWCCYEPDPTLDNGKHIVLISGDDEYRSEEALPMLGKILARKFGFTCTTLFAIDEETGQIKPDHQTNIPGMEHLEDCDLVILALRFRGLPDKQMKYLDDYLNSGKPVIGLRTSTHAFRFTDEMNSSFRHYDFRGDKTWHQGFGKQVLGETWVNHHGHHGKQSTRGIINEKHADNIVLTGVTDVWGPTDVYGIRKLPEGCNVLLHGQVLEGMQPDSPALKGAKNDPMMPLAWTRNWKAPSGKECQVFCTTIGSSTDFESEGLRRLIVNVSLNMTGQDMQIAADSDVDYVDEYNPTNFGFGSYRKDVKPADYNLK